MNIILSSDYDFYYISIGSSCTETTSGNCEYQLFPSFIRNEKKTLNIIIEPSFPETRAIVDRYKKDFPNMEILFLPYSVPQENLEQSPFFHLFQDLIAIWNQKEVPKNNIVIINFIQFKIIEQNEKALLLSEQIYKSLQNPNEQSSQLDASQRQSHYFHCLYIWFGYSPILYNCFYKYKYYDNTDNCYKKFFETFRYFQEVRTHTNLLRNFLIKLIYGNHVYNRIRNRKERQKLEKMLLIDEFYENVFKMIQKDKIEPNEKVIFFLKNSFCLRHPYFENFYKQLE